LFLKSLTGAHVAHVAYASSWPQYGSSSGGCQCAHHRIPELVPDAQRVASRRPLHRPIVATRHSNVEPVIPVHHLPGPGQVYLAVVEAGRGGLQAPYESVVGVRLGVQLVPEEGLGSLLGPRAVPAPPRLGLLSSGLTAAAWPGSLVLMEAPWTMPFRTRSPFSSSRRCSSSHTNLSVPVSARRSPYRGFF